MTVFLYWLLFNMPDFPTIGPLDSVFESSCLIERASYADSPWVRLYLLDLIQLEQGPMDLETELWFMQKRNQIIWEL